MKFKSRASASGKLTSQPRTKKAKEAGELSKTVQSYCKEWIKEQLYGVKKEFSNKYTDKGNLMEDNAIEMTIGWLGLPLLTEKNEQFFEDDYFTGTPDIILDDEIIDIKCSYDCFTFPLFEDELPNKDYYSQLQVYMHLTGKRKARVVFCLMNTPDGVADWEEKHDYSNVNPELRYKKYAFEYDADHIEFLKSQVDKCRKFINTLKY